MRINEQVLDPKKLKHAMIDSDMNQSGLAKAIGADESRVSIWVRGKGNPDLPYAKKISKALGVTIDSLLLD